MAYPILTGYGHRILTISASNTNLTIIACLTNLASRACNGYAIFTIAAILVDLNGVSDNIFIHLNGNTCITSPILVDKGLDIIATIVAISLVAFAFNRYLRPQFISLNATFIGIEFKTLVNQVIRSVLNLIG